LPSQVSGAIGTVQLESWWEHSQPWLRFSASYHVLLGTVWITK